jgi:ABC-type oligopeptide transport system substrate-binding subunit
MYYYNGTPIPMTSPPIVDNSFSVGNPKTIEMYVPAGATHYERVLTTIAENLNRIATRTYNTTTGQRDPEGEQLGITFVVVPVPGGQQYTLASRHEIYMYWGGWHADYNHILNWLGPMYLSSGTYFSWNLWNVTRLDEIYFEAIEADKEGNMTRLVELSNEANRIANDMVLYLWLWHPMPYYVRTSWLKNWYYNPSLGAEYIAAMYYETPP